MPRFTLRNLFWLISLCAVGSCTVVSFRSQVTYNATRDDVWLQLPADATRINRYQPGAMGPNTYFEFDTSEESFLAWVGRYRNAKLVNHSGPHRIYRYSAYGPNADPNDAVTIMNGLLFEWLEEDRGEHIAYDRDSGRAYYWSHTR